MNRRHILFGLGALTIGGAAVVGTGALTRSDPTRSVRLRVIRASGAPLQIEPAVGSTDLHIIQESDDELVFDIDRITTGQLTDETAGIRAFESLFNVCNATTKPIETWIGTLGNRDFPDDIDAVDPVGNRRLTLFTGDSRQPRSVMGTSNALTIEPEGCVTTGASIAPAGIDLGERDYLFSRQMTLFVDGSVQVTDGYDEISISTDPEVQFDDDELTDIDLPSPLTVKVYLEDDEGDLFTGSTELDIRVANHAGVFDEAPVTANSGSLFVEFNDGEGTFTIGAPGATGTDLTLWAVAEGGTYTLDEIDDIETIEVTPDADLTLTGLSIFA